MALPDLNGVQLKFERACKQLDALKNEIASFVDGDAYMPSVQFRTKFGNGICITDFTIRMEVNTPCPPMWGVIVGEIIHNFRSALDHAVYQMFLFINNRLPPAVNRLQFPIFNDPAKFDACSLTMLKGIGKKGTSLIKSFQPFSTGENESSPLWHLDKLSNTDKHRMIHLVGGALESFDFRFPPLANPGHVEKRIRSHGAFEHNTIIAEGRFVGIAPPFGNSEQVKVNAECRFNIVFDQRTPVVGEWAVIGTLLNIADRTRAVLDAIGKGIFEMEIELASPAGSTRPR